MAKAKTKKSNKIEKYHNYIGGEWVKSASGEWFENLNPADTTDIIGRFPKSNADDVHAAVAAAKSAATRWRRTPAPKRAEILFRLAQILEKKKEVFTRDMTREMGKVLKEAGGDVQEAIDCTYYTAGEGRRLARLYDSGGNAEQICDVRPPTCWNLRIDYAVQFSDGDSFVEADSGVSLRKHGRHQIGRRHAAFDDKFSQILEEAGIPKGVINIVNGFGEAGAALVESRRRAADFVHRLDRHGQNYRRKMRGGKQNRVRWKWAAKTRLS